MLYSGFAEKQMKFDHSGGQALEYWHANIMHCKKHDYVIYVEPILSRERGPLTTTMMFGTSMCN